MDLSAIAGTVQNNISLPCINMELRYIIAACLGLLHRCSCRLIDKRGLRRSSAWIGRYGEKTAASWLRTKGYRILRRNFRLGTDGEIDLVCRHGDTLVFVEVKTRTRSDYGSPGRAVDAPKRRLLRRGARRWLHLLKRETPYRFDIVEIILRDGRKPSMRLRQKAFAMQEKRSAA